ncbi:MAG: amidohydrolase [Woeseia sp.]
MSTLTVSIVQAELHWHDPQRNLLEFAKILTRQESTTDLIVLPEMFSTGFTMDAAAHAERMDGRTVSWMAETAQKSGAAICGSLIIEADGNYYNRFVLTRADGTAVYYDKRHLFRLADEHEHYAPGTKLRTFDLNGWRIRPMVCYDLRFPVWSRNRDEYELLIYVANWPDRRHQAWETLIRARAIENLSFVAAVNRIGTDGNDKKYIGGSAIIDYLGNYLVSFAAEPGMSSATLDMTALAKFREKFPFHLDADAFALSPDPRR